MRAPAAFLDPTAESQRQAPSADVVSQVHRCIGEAIRIRRRKMGVSLRELSSACGISLQQIQKYEVGASSISAAQLWKLANCLAVPVEQFFERLDPALLRDAPAR